MAVKRPAKGGATGQGGKGPAGSAVVEEHLRRLEHPMKAEIEAVRKILLGADPRIGEEIKWNAPSFHLGEHFATFHLRPRDCVQIIFHRGAKARADALAAGEVPDPAGLAEWLGKDRCTVKLRGMADVEAKRGALTAFVREWIRRL